MTAPSLGIDVGGTKCLGVVIEGDGVRRDIVAETRAPTPYGGDALIEALVSIVGALEAGLGGDRPVGAIGVGAPGLITHAGVLRSSPNVPGVTDLDLGGRLGAALGRPVTVGNDATCAVLAEWTIGAARHADDVVMVTLGTGIGGGVVAGGRLVTGANGFTGEFGHMVVDPNGPPCPCGRRGCWERYASGTGLAQLARTDAVGGRLRRVVELAGGAPELVRGEHVQAAALEGDAGAMAVIDEFARWVAIGLVNLTNALDPAAIVLGGGLAVGADLYLGPIERWFDALLYSPELRPHPDLVFAELGERAGAIGAAMLAASRAPGSSR
ncbi:MAG: ROK family protein [Ilumatobacteraceae bacterium]